VVVAHIPDLKLGTAIQMVRRPCPGSVHLRLKVVKHPDFVAACNQRVHKV